ncbi:MAG: tRNA pseudouridine13 synthase [Oceanicoccus sp.]|jgi:tRNA pseudouridine13 synthase
MLSTETSRQPLPYVNTCPDFFGNLRERPEYFQVEEILGFEPAGEGEHIFLFIEKTTLNTQQVANKLADLAEVPLRQVSYAGMKDRNAITRQWFSVHLPGNSEIDFSSINNDQLTVLKQKRHLRKLRRGVHQGNKFDITLSNIKNVVPGRHAAESFEKAHQVEFEQRVSALSSLGFPNYFGEQRFGRNGSNIEQVEKWFMGSFKPKKHQRGLYLSSARSFLFNQVLAERVRENSWNQTTSGELLMLNGTQSVFPQGQDDLEARIRSGDIHPTGPMYGKSGKLMPEEEVGALESRLLSEYGSLTRGLELHGLKAERRALRVIPADLKHIWADDRVSLTFSLPRGCYATALVRELVNYQVE